MKKPKITIQPETSKSPITLIGYEAGVCWGADISDEIRNYKRGMDCIHAKHGRLLEFPQIYISIEGFSARMIRELYTHIGGSPTRLQASTRRIDYSEFDYITPPSIGRNTTANEAYMACMNDICCYMKKLEELGIPREDLAMCLPLAMESTVVMRTNLRNLVDMSRQRMCGKAYWEFRNFFKLLLSELAAYDKEYDILIKEDLFVPKCKDLGYCPEKSSCGLMPNKERED